MMWGSLRISFKKDCCAGLPHNGFGDNSLGLVRRLILIAFTLAAVSTGKILFAGPASLDSEKIENILQDEKKPAGPWAKIFDSVHGFIEADYGPKFSGKKLTQKNGYNLLEQRL